jgi:hypothetical protein
MMKGCDENGLPLDDAHPFFDTRNTRSKDQDLGRQDRRGNRARTSFQGRSTIDRDAGGANAPRKAKKTGRTGTAAKAGGANAPSGGPNGPRKAKKPSRTDIAAKAGGPNGPSGAQAAWRRR